ncbi:MAG: hypothetical protein ABI199_06825 [Bacteroidia bacterium]
MKSPELSPQAIEKEKISELKFHDREVLPSAEHIKHRWSELQRASKLGNIEHGKIKIIFEDTGGLKQVETTIWAVTDKRIILKKGVVIPIHCIHEVKV